MNDEHASTRIDESLVAYLDGELSGEQRQRIEQRLAKDADFRRQLNDLQQSWDLLDTLSRAETDQELTQSTIAIVAPDRRPSARS